MSELIIEKYKPTGEFYTTLDFGNKQVDWNMVHKQVHSGCHCIWVESDLESYVTVYGQEVKCVRDIFDCLVDTHKRNMYDQLYLGLGDKV